MWNGRGQHVVQARARRMIDVTDGRRKFVTLASAGRQAARHAGQIMNEAPATFATFTMAQLSEFEGLHLRLID